MDKSIKNVLERKGWIKEEQSDANDKVVFITADILPLDRVNRNGRKFSKEVIQKALNDLNGQPIPCRVGFPRISNGGVIEHDLDHVIGMVELSIRDDMLVGNMKISKELASKYDANTENFVCNGLKDGTLVPAPFGSGNAKPLGDDAQEIDNYSISGIAIIDKQQSVL